MDYVSILPGRVRFKSQAIYYNAKLAKYTEKYIHSLYGVKSGKVTEKTGSILVIYNMNKTNLKLLKEKIENALAATKVKDCDDVKVLDQYMTVIEKKKIARRKFLLWSAFYLLLKIKGFSYGKFSISRNLTVLKVAAAVTIIGGYPLLKKIYKKLTKHVPADTDLLLEISALSFTILRESSKGILVLILKALDDYIKLNAEAESRKELLDSYKNNFKMAWIKSSEGKDVLVSVDSLEPDDYIYVYPGEIAPAGGIIEEGNAVVNHLYSTGQPLITPLGKGAKIEEGIAVISGNIKVRVTKSADTTDKKDISPENLFIQNNVKEYMDKMTFFALGTAAMSYIYTGNILNAFSVMLVLSPKAASVALNSGMKNYFKLLNKNKIYLQNPNTFENINNTDKIIFDKTGTLTYGKMKIITIISFDSNYSQNDIRKIFSACEAGHYHPISSSVQKDDNEIPVICNSVLIPSRGVRATCFNKEIIIGNEDLMKENEIDYSIGIEKYQSLQNESFIPVFVAVNKKLVGIIAVNDVLRTDAKPLIDKLHYHHINDISLLTGDSNPRVRDIASQLGINRVYYDKDYLEKEKIVETERDSGIVMMVGDGINDISAMRAAHVSVSFSDFSYDKVKLQSDCIIYDDDLLKLTDLILLSQKSYLSIKRTILFSNIYNIFFGIIAFRGGLNIFTAKSLNTLNSMFVLILNKRILYMKPGKYDITE